MDNRVVIYAVIAISLGYLLVSAVPSRLAVPILSGSDDESDIYRGPPLESESVKDGSLSEESSNGDFLSSESSQEEILTQDRISKNIISVVSTLSLNFIIALGVFFIARRKYF